MTVRVGIVTNPLDPATWEHFDVEDVNALIVEKFPSWPDTARIYDLEGFGDWTRAAALVDPSVLSRRDVTPRGKPGTPEGEASVHRLAELRGPLLVIVPPADPITAIVAVVAVVIGVAAAFLLLPRIPGSQKQPSPNNALAERSNQARPNGRIVDIFGTVESTPDLLAVPYAIFENNIEIEIAYMGVGRGSYEVARVRDDTTSLASIAGSSAAVYAPFTSPNSGDAPQLQIGTPIPELVRSVVKLNGVNGQTLKPSNANNIQGDDNIRFVYPDTIETNSGDIDFTTLLAPGDALMVQRAGFSENGGIVTTIANARFTSAGVIEFDSFDPSTAFTAAQYLTIANGGYAGEDGLGGIIYVDVSGTYLIDSVGPTSVTLDDPAAINGDWDRIGDYPGNHTDYGSRNFSVPDESGGLNLSGSYTALAVASDHIVLNNPALVNANWNDLDDLPGGATDYISPVISLNTDVWIGPFIIDLDYADEIIANIVGMNGLYYITKKGNQGYINVDVELEATPVNSNDAPIGPAELFGATVYGSRTEKTTVATTLRAHPSFSGRCSVRMRRSSPEGHDKNWAQQVEEVKWRDCFGTAPVDQEHFGDMTTVMTRTVATAGALSVKNRRLNMRVTRKLPQRISGSTFGALAATDSVADILAAMALDPFIGRRTPQEVDFDSIYDTVAAVVDYFGSPLAGEFGYSFDDNDVSFEEMAQTVAQAIFCTCYRQGRVMRLAFERATEESSLIFNARNTMPGSQRRTVRFGPLEDHDGVELDYTDPVDGATLTFAIPPDGTANSPRSIEVVGVRSYPLAYWQAWRAWNKVRYQNVALELEATQEAALVIPQDRVLVADRTRPNILQGEVDAEDGTTLILSHPAPITGTGWTIFLQHVDGTVEALGATAGANDYEVELSAAPRMALSVDPENFAQATYMLVPEADVQTRAFLVSEREPNSNFTETMRAVNYSFLYYQNDELVLWLDFARANFFDSGPYMLDGIPAGGATVEADTNRGLVMKGVGVGSRATFPLFTTPTSYTKSAWINRADLTTAGSILNNAHEVFGFAAGSDLQGGHDGVDVSAPWPAANTWHHAALTYDADEGEMVLYLNGVLADSAAGVPARTIAQLVGFDGLLGNADDLRLWKRALSPTEVLEVYRSTKVGISGYGIGLESGGGLLTEDGGRLILE